MQVAGGYRRPLPQYVPQQVRELISKCWAQEAHARPDIAAVLNCLKHIERLGVLDADSASADVGADGAKRAQPVKKACCVLM
jgi:hypothetical protein